jgi:O-antigen/teichoic acid export membrane protein
MNQTWVRHMPVFIRQKLDGRKPLQQAIGNTGWLLFERILRMIIGLTIGAWVARYLGPAQFGELAYVISFIAFFQVITRLEADSFIVRDIAQERGESSVILGSALWMRLCFGLFFWAFAIFFMLVLHPNDHQLIILTTIVGGTLVFQASDTIDLWFQSQSQSRRTVISKLVPYLFSNCVKVILLIFKAPLAAFAGVMCLEAAVMALGLVIAYRRFPTINRWRASYDQARALLNLCWPYIISGIMITTYLRIDQIMLKEMLGERALGIYAAALPMSQIWSVLPATLVTSLAPYVAQKKAMDERLYQDALVNIFRSFAIVAFIVSSLTALASPWIIQLLYGSQYQSTAFILRMHVFVNLFIFQGMAQSLWVTNNNVRAVIMLSTFLAATINIISNALMIRKFGIQGAVYSILLTEFVAAAIPCLLRRDLRDLYKKAFFFQRACG